MSVELKIFGSACFVKDKALRKDSSLKPLARAVKAPNKGVAETIIAGKMAEHYPANIDDYFKAKVWEHNEDLPLPPLGEFSTDFFETVAVWDVNAGKPTLMETESTDGEDLQDNDSSSIKMKTVKLLGQQSRAYCLAMFGPVQDITESQYGQIIDMVNDEDGGFTRELAEAISREPRVLVLLMARQEELLAYVREKAKESAQWTDIKKLIVKWLDTPAEKREPVKLKTDGPETGDETHTESGCTLGGGNVTDRPYTHNLASLRRETCIGILAVAMDFNIYELPRGIHDSAKKMEEVGTDERFTAWWKQFRRTPGILDYSKAAIIALIKSSPENIYRDPIALREYINKNLTESDHANPDPLTVDIACGRSSFPLPQTTNEAGASSWSELSDDEIGKDIDRMLAARATAGQQNADSKPKIENLGGGVFSVDGLMSSNNGANQEMETTSDAQIQETVSDEKSAGNALPPGESTLEDGSETNAGVADNRQPVSERDVVIAFALNDLFSGRTNIIDKGDIESIVSCAGHLISHVFPLLITDITTTEFCLSPNFSDVEIQDVATTILESWSDDENIRQKIALDAIVEYRKPAPPKKTSTPEPVSINNAQVLTADPASLTWRQQLITSALQGMLSNPAYSGMHDDIPIMAITMADTVISAEDGR